MKPRPVYSFFGSIAPFAMALGAVAVGLANASTARAAFLFYNGDPSTSYTSFPAATWYPSNFGLIFENFTVPAGLTWTINGVYENIVAPSSIVTGSPNGMPDSILYEIRTGLTAGSFGAGTPGTTIIAETLNPTYTINTAVTAGSGTTAYTVQALYPANSPAITTLQSGNYWIGIGPIVHTQNSWAYTSVLSTGGANAINAAGNNTVIADNFDTSFSKFNYSVSYGLEGTVPEPATISILAAAGILLPPRRRRRIGV